MAGSAIEAFMPLLYAQNVLEKLGERAFRGVEVGVPAEDHRLVGGEASAGRISVSVDVDGDRFARLDRQVVLHRGADAERAGGRGADLDFAEDVRVARRIVDFDDELGGAGSGD